MSAIVAMNVYKKFGDFTALNGVNLDIQQGTFFGFCGPNGAGKSTLLKILTCQIPPSAGAASIFGLDIEEKPFTIKNQIAIMPESESPPSFLTAEEFLYFVAKVRELDNIEERVEKWLEFFKIVEKRNTLCKDLSKGMRQKVMLAATMMPDSPLLFLDEPFINLDPIFQRKLRVYLAEYIRRGGTIFMCTHILEIAEKLCSQLAIINRGTVIASGTMGQLRIAPNENLEQVFMRLVGNVEAGYVEGI